MASGKKPKHRNDFLCNVKITVVKHVAQITRTYTAGVAVVVMSSYQDGLSSWTSLRSPTFKKALDNCIYVSAAKASSIIANDSLKDDDDASMIVDSNNSLLAAKMNTTFQIPCFSELQWCILIFEHTELVYKACTSDFPLGPELTFVTMQNIFELWKEIHRWNFTECRVAISKPILESSVRHER